MKNSIPFVVLILLCSCANSSSKTSDKGTNKPMQTIHKFIRYLKKPDLNSAKNMLPFKDTSSINRNKYDIHETTQIGEAVVALENDDIVADSLWISDTLRKNGELYLVFAGTLKKDIGNPDPKSIFRFIFSLANSDTSLVLFDYNPPKPSQQEAIENKQMQTIHKLISYLKKNDIKNAQGMLLSLDSLVYINHRENFDASFSQLKNVQKALQLNDIDETTWRTDTVMVSNWIHTIIYGNLKKKPGSKYSNVLLRFEFISDVSGPELWFLDYNPHD